MAFRNGLRTLGAIAAVLPEADITAAASMVISADDDGSDMGSGRNFTRANIEVANGMTFQSVSCNEENPDATGRVLLIHGVGYAMDAWRLLMRKACNEGWHVVAYNQRGYSLNGPANREQYHWDLFREDAFGVADVLEWDTFNLVGVGYGAFLGYYMVDSDAGKSRVSTFTAMGYPHPNLFNDAVAGDASKIVPSMEALTQNAHFYFQDGAAALFFNAGVYYIDDNFKSVEELQKAIYMFLGSIDSGLRAVPRLYNITENVLPEEVRTFLGLPDEGKPAIPANYTFGNVEMPFLYVTGNQDQFIEGWKDWALRTREFAATTYAELVVDADAWLQLQHNDTSVMNTAIVGHWSAGGNPADESFVRSTPALLRNSIFWLVVSMIVFS